MTIKLVFFQLVVLVILAHTAMAAYCINEPEAICSDYTGAVNWSTAPDQRLNANIDFSDLGSGTTWTMTLTTPLPYYFDHEVYSWGTYYQEYFPWGANGSLVFTISDGNVFTVNTFGMGREYLYLTNYFYDGVFVYQKYADVPFIGRFSKPVDGLYLANGAVHLTDINAGAAAGQTVEISFYLVPEPSTFLMLGSGVFGILDFARRFRR